MTGRRQVVRDRAAENARQKPATEFTFIDFLGAFLAGYIACEEGTLNGESLLAAATQAYEATSQQASKRNTERMGRR
jgi:hypothetical protein